MINKILIPDSSESHRQDVYNSFVQSYNSSGLVWNGSVVYGDSNLNQSMLNTYSDIDVIIHSYGDLANHLQLATDNPDKLICMPAGSNSSVLVYNGNIPTSICVTGCGTEQNITGYKVEFFDIDPLYGDASSFSNGYIAGKIAAIANYHKCTIQKARLIARYCSSLYPTPTERDGYGVIDIQKALSKVFPDKIAVRFTS